MTGSDVTWPDEPIQVTWPKLPTFVPEAASTITLLAGFRWQFRRWNSVLRLRFGIEATEGSSDVDPRPIAQMFARRVAPTPDDACFPAIAVAVANLVEATGRAATIGALADAYVEGGMGMGEDLISVAQRTFSDWSELVPRLLREDFGAAMQTAWEERLP